MHLELLLYLKLQPSQSYKLSLYTNTTWEIPQQARKVTLPNQAIEKCIPLEPEPTEPSVNISRPSVRRKKKEKR